MHAVTALVTLVGVLASAAAPAPASDTVAPHILEQFVDQQFVPPLRSYDQHLSIGAARCPRALDRRAAQKVYCTVSVDGVPVSVGVFSDEASHLALVQSSFFDFQGVASLEKAELLEQYDVTATDVRCPGPRFRNLPIGETVSCYADGSFGRKPLSLTVYANGVIYMQKPAGSLAPAWMRSAIDAHAAGKRTIVDGATLALWQQQANEAALAARHQAGSISVQCPPTVDLSGSKHAICTYRFHGSSIRLDVHIDPVRGVSSVPLDAILDWDKLERTARETIDSDLRANGRTPDASVRCDRTVLVATPPAVFYCSIVAGGKSYKAQVTLKDGLGNVQFTIVP
jgi:hypothetical protein